MRLHGDEMWSAEVIHPSAGYDLSHLAAAALGPAGRVRAEASSPARPSKRPEAEVPPGSFPDNLHPADSFPRPRLVEIREIDTPKITQHQPPLFHRDDYCPPQEY